MIADIFAGKRLYEGVDNTRNHAADPAPQRAADDARRHADLIASPITVKRRHDRQMLERIDDVEKVAETKIAVLPGVKILRAILFDGRLGRRDFRAGSAVCFVGDVRER